MDTEIEIEVLDRMSIDYGQVLQHPFEVKENPESYTNFFARPEKYIYLLLPP
jgi:hypothetical protein